MEQEEIWSAADQTEISIQDLDEVFVRNIIDMVSEWQIATSFNCCIYRVPENIRSVKHSAYVPSMISIGPYHYGEERLRSTQGFKMTYCKALIERSCKTFSDVLKILASEESKARCFYENLVEMSNREFLGMILVDACFIIEYMIRLHYPRFEQHIDVLMPKKLIQNYIKHDLVLLENQIPFFILELLFDVINPFSSFSAEERSETGSLRGLVLSFFAEYNQNGIGFTDESLSSVKHFTDLIRTLHIPKLLTYRHSLKQASDSEFVVNATQLHQSGVMFKASQGKCLLEINFKNPHLNLTPFELNDEKESLYRNILAFEACHYPNQPFIADYFVFMDTLIDDSHDVALLVQSGVLLNRLGDNWAAADRFNCFRTGITHQSAASYLRPVCHKLNLHYQKPKNTWMTSFKRNYFDTPITAACSILAFLVTLFTFISSVCSIISVIQG
jgi:hypothetical protein